MLKQNIILNSPYSMQHNKAEQREQKTMGYLMILAMWAVILGLLAFLFQDILNKQHNPNQNINAANTEQQTRELVLQRNHYGHYVADGLINNHPVTFLLDTGASDVSVPADVAQKIGLQAGQKRYYRTANGKAAVYATQLDEISLGNIKLHNIRATINPNVKDMEILLGMSFLKQIEFTQRGKTLTLRQYKP